MKNLWKSAKDRTRTYARVFDGPDGKRVLFDLYQRYMATDPIGKTEMHTFINVGQEVVIRDIMRTIGANQLELEEDSGRYSVEWQPE